MLRPIFIFCWVFRILFWICLIILITLQTRDYNWLAVQIYETGNFGTYLEVRRFLYNVTFTGVIVFFIGFSWLYPIRHGPVTPSAARQGAEVAHEAAPAPVKQGPKKGPTGHNDFLW